MPENLQHNPWFQLVLVIALAGAAIYCGKKLFPNTDQMELDKSALETKNTELKVIVDTGLRLEKRLPELRREIREKEKQLDTLKKIIPTEREAEDLIRKLERMAAETSINVKSFAPQPQRSQEFYFEWPIALKATGSYHNLGRFFSRIGNYARIINVQAVRVTATPGQGPAETINATFTALTYVYKEEK